MSERLHQQAERSVRKSKNPTANESLIIALLKEATSQFPMQQNMSIISACLRCPPEITKLDMDLLRAIRDLSHSFIIARENRQQDWVSWAYPFRPLSGEYEKFVEPWAHGIDITRIEDENYLESYPKIPRELTYNHDAIYRYEDLARLGLLKVDPSRKGTVVYARELLIWFCAKWLPKYTFDQLEISFAGWSAAHCQRFAAKIADFLSPASNALLARVLAGMPNTSGGMK